jgi:hypothetical protein
MPNGKPAGVRCVQLTADNRCLLFGKLERPGICAQMRPSEEMCGASNEEAMEQLNVLEVLTRPTR